MREGILKIETEDLSVFLVSRRIKKYLDSQGQPLFYIARFRGEVLLIPSLERNIPNRILLFNSYPERFPVFHAIEEVERIQISRKSEAEILELLE